MQELRPSAIGGLGGASSAVRTDALDESLAGAEDLPCGGAEVVRGVLFT